jgi:phosphoglycerate transport regulatory protein PgtC
MVSSTLSVLIKRVIMTSHYQLQSLKQLLLVGSLMLSSLFATAADKVVVLTSYPQEVISHFEASFEKAYPAYTLDVIWKQSNDALAFIKNNRQQVDVYWTPSRNNFVELGNEGYFLKLDEKVVPPGGVINGLQLNDPNGYYAATEIAGLGMVLNAAKLEKLTLKPPKDWVDLADPKYKANIAFPVPSKIGFATGLLDAMLQGKTWEEGWKTILAVSANAKLIDAGSMFVTDEIASGQQAVGITMDFFAASAIAKGANITYVYPPHVTYSPAHVALLKDAPNMAGAKAFVAFTLSRQGQALLFHPDIRKLPVDATVYAQKPTGYFNPFEYAVNDTGSVPRDFIRLQVLNSLFDAMVTQHHAQLVALYGKFNQAKLVKPGDQRLNDVIRYIGSPVLTEQETNAPAVQQAFAMRKKDAGAEKQVREYEAAWSNLAVQQYEKAGQLLDAVLTD